MAIFAGIVLGIFAGLFLLAPFALSSRLSREEEDDGGQ